MPERLAVIRRQQAVIEEQRRAIDGLRDLLVTERAAHAQTRITMQAQIDTLTARVRTLEQRLGEGDVPRGVPGTKPTTPKKPASAEPKTRKQRLGAFVRRRGVPTELVEHAFTACPDCGATLRGGSVKRTREVIELPAIPVAVIEHRFIERRCAVCQRDHTPTDAVLAGVVAGQQRFGVGLVSLLVTLREEFRLPVAQIRRLLALRHGLTLSVGAIVAATQRVARQGAGVVEQLVQHVRASPVVHADETGWREGGSNRFVWLFTTPQAAVFRLGGRDGGMVDAVLGEGPSPDAGFGGVLVSDFYAAYHHYPGPKQRCWAHLLRDIHTLTVRFPTDLALQRWAAAVKALYEDAKAYRHPNERQRIVARRAFERRLVEVCLPFWDGEATEPPDGDPATPTTLCRRIVRHLEELFVFVECPEVPPDNNAAERGLRHLVVSRKISGGTRSSSGSTTKMTLASLFATWRLTGTNPLAACRQVLTSPRL
ncbi:MAG: IS66 family transposase [Dehalococcoidia bacterium]